MSERKRASTPTPFFVGYKRIPPGLKGFLWLCSAALIATGAWVSYSIASHQIPAGQGLWNASEPVTLEGTLTVAPYPILHRSGEVSAGEAESVMLVMIGKHAADVVSEAHAGLHVSVSGYAISRGGWLMLEITGNDAIKPTGKSLAPGELEAIDTRLDLGSVTLQGRIEDSKCFLGVMKPGGGPVHKACAEMCLLGGIPPMLVVSDAQDRRVGYLLTGADGSSASTAVASLSAEPVEVRGTLEQQGDMLYIRMDEAGVSRL